MKRINKGSVLFAFLQWTAVVAVAASPLKSVETIAPPFKFGPWIGLMANSGARTYRVDVEIINDSPTQVLGEVEFYANGGKKVKRTFRDGTGVTLRTENSFSRIRVRVKTTGPTGAAVRITQR